MGAFHRLEYAAGVYNLQVQAWNKHATSQTLDEKTVTDPVKPGFTTIGCFNHCGDFFNTFSDAESSHKEPCGTARNVDEMVADQYWNEMLAAFEPNEGQILAGRNVLAGCGRHYYDCPSVSDTEHEPQTCSVSGCTVQYRKCLRHTKDHSNHSAASCLVTNANGDYCTVTSFYACQYHTHVYPAPPPTPSATCANGHSYDPDNRPENNQHRTRTCQHCSQTWEVC
ncbi:hypothetical protein J4G08_21085 [Candidatus Poribacteria bacterium]|nr:hypothetical protein [Candidatus Poribacteria bacterium]